MIKVFIPTVKDKAKTKARGFWYSQDSKKIYYDYLKVVDYSLGIADLYGFNRFRDYLDNLKVSYEQEAIFYINDNIGNCYYSRDKIQALPHRIYKEVLRVDLKSTIKKVLKTFGGCTVYNEAGRYYIEVFATI